MAWKVPPQARRATSAPQRLAGPPQQLGRGPPAEGEQQDPLGRVPSATRRATRAARVVVLPVPAPATTRRWPPSCSTARALRISVEAVGEHGFDGSTTDRTSVLVPGPPPPSQREPRQDRPT